MKGKPGRPSKFSPELADQICELMVEIMADEEDDIRAEIMADEECGDDLEDDYKLDEDLENEYQDALEEDK
tara:strand:- start:262 stop:474 length:213 start_codon:yes stop_codon:yes gene_type:complete